MSRIRFAGAALAGLLFAAWLGALSGSAEDRKLRAGHLHEILPSDTAAAVGFGDMVTGADGRMWISEGLSGRVARIDPASGDNLELTLPQRAIASNMTVGPDGSVWFVDARTDRTRYGRIRPDGSTSVYAMRGKSKLDFLAVATDGAVWMDLQENGSNADPDIIERIDPDLKTRRFFRDWPYNFSVGGMTAGPGGTLWIANYGAPTYEGTPSIVRLDAQGRRRTFSLPTKTNPHALAFDTHGDLWISNHGYTEIGRLSPAGTYTAYALTHLPVSDRRAPTALLKLAASSDGMWGIDPGRRALFKVASDGTVVTTTIGTGTGFGVSANDLAVAPDGTPWFAIDEVHVGHLDREGNVVPIALGVPQPERALADHLAAGARGEVWMQNDGAATVSLVKADGTFAELHRWPAADRPFIGVIQADDRGGVWTTDRTGFAHLARDGTFSHVLFAWPAAPKWKRMRVAHDGSLWFAGSGVPFQRRAPDGTFAALRLPPGDLYNFLPGPGATMVTIIHGAAYSAYSIARLGPGGTGTWYPFDAGIDEAAPAFAVAPDGALWIRNSRPEPGTMGGPIMQPDESTRFAPLGGSDAGLTIGTIVNLSRPPDGSVAGPDGDIWSLEQSQDANGPTMRHTSRGGVERHYRAQFDGAA